MNNEKKDRDKYRCPKSHVLRNKLNIQDSSLLNDVERSLVTLRQLEKIPVGNFGPSHPKAIQKFSHQEFKVTRTVSREWVRQAAKDEMEFGEEIGAGLLPLDPFFTRERMCKVCNFVTREAFGYYIAYNSARLRHSGLTYAEMIGISPSELAQIENDIWYEPSYEVLDKLATFLNVDRQKLIDLSGIEKPKCESFTMENFLRLEKIIHENKFS